MSAGKLSSRIAFQKREKADDGFGMEVVGDFVTQFTVWAQLTPRLGSETVIAARLQGVQPYTIRVRMSSQTRLIDATWRAVNAATGQAYSIVSPPVDIDQKNAYLDILATSGAGEQ